MGNSTVTLQNVVDYALTYSELKPSLGVGGFSQQPALTIANDVMTAMVQPAFNWKWNRMMVTPFYTISWQQDYAIPGLTTLAWIEHCWIIDINNTAIPKPIWPLEAVRDLERTSTQYGRPGQIAWLPNDQLTYGTWGAGSTGNSGTAGNNPKALQAITNPLGQTQTPTNPTTQIQDTNGNLQVVTLYGTTGATIPSWPAASAAAGTNTLDGSVIWTVVDPKGQGFRLSPIPPQSGVVYQVNVVAQKRPVAFTSLGQTLDPIPDDFASYFRAGFVAKCYEHSPEPGVRQKAASEMALWMKSLMDAVKQGDRERDSAGFYPDKNIMDSGGYWPVSPAWPYPPNW